MGAVVGASVGAVVGVSVDAVVGAVGVSVGGLVGAVGALVGVLVRQPEHAAQLAGTVVSCTMVRIPDCGNFIQ